MKENEWQNCLQSIYMEDETDLFIIFKPPQFRNGEVYNVIYLKRVHITVYPPILETAKYPRTTSETLQASVSTFKFMTVLLDKE